MGDNKKIRDRLIKKREILTVRVEKLSQYWLIWMICRKDMRIIEHMSKQVSFSTQAARADEDSNVIARKTG